MKVKELIQKLQQCNPEYKIVLGQMHVIREDAAGELSKVALEEAQDDDWVIRVDNPIEQVFFDAGDEEVCLFASTDDHGNQVTIVPEKASVQEVTLPGEAVPASACPPSRCGGCKGCG